MVSWDIKNFYPNCQTDLCIEAVGKVLDRRPPGTLPSKESILEALQITMSCNNATFLGSHFTQVNGATIGGPESACVTDIFGAEFIDQIAMRGGPIEPENWKRYRDDTLDIKANCTLKELEEFTNYLNENVLPGKILFVMENSREKLSFLDVNIGLTEGYLITEIYSKAIDSHEYLNPKSCHPPSVANNNPLRVALRVRRNCSDRIENDKIFKRNLVEYKAHLMHSGYKSNLIDRKFLKVVKKKRSKAIANKKEDLKCRSRKYNYVTDFDPGFPNIMSTIQSCLPTLHEDPQCKEMFPKSFQGFIQKGAC